MERGKTCERCGCIVYPPGADLCPNCDSPPESRIVFRLAEGADRRPVALSDRWGRLQARAEGMGLGLSELLDVTTEALEAFQGASEPAERALVAYLSRVRDCAVAALSGRSEPIAWEVQVQPDYPPHALRRTVTVRASNPKVARLIALNVAEDQWPEESFRAISAVPKIT